MNSELLSLAGGGERITVEATGVTYDDALGSALSRMRRLAPTDGVGREYEDAQHGDWYVSSSECRGNLSGSNVEGTFTFSRALKVDDD